MLLRSRFVLLSWAVFLACGLLALGADRADAEEVLASWYGPGYDGLPTASGEPYDASGYTASHETLPFGTELEVSYGGRSVLVTVDDRGDFPDERGLDLSQAAAQELGLTIPGVDYVEVGYPSGGARNNAAPVGGYPSVAEGSTSPGADGQTSPPISASSVPLEANQADGLIGDGTGSLAYRGGSSVIPPGTALGEAHGGVSGSQSPQNGLPPDVVPSDEVPLDVVVPPDGATRSPVFNTTAPYTANDPAFVAQPNELGTDAYLPVQPYAVDTGFVGRQEGFRLDAYVPDPWFSRSGTTVGTGVDVGQRSAAEIQALDIPEALKQKLIPYAGLTGQDAVNLLTNRPLRLTADEAYALDRAVAQDIFGDVATLYDASATEGSFLELPLEARTAIGDVAYQYGPNLEQRLPNFWGDVTQGRWDEATQTLRDFGDRYPARRNDEADLLEQAIGRGDLASYLVQPGDTLSGVASRRGTSAEYLAARNGVADPDVIYGGQALYY
ncbi:MAG: pesticin C-terminus-like muramidase [Actinobacteria bacterium]|nr:pesticin C-terminus-like muramidase [Actinomycetota bacterium]